MNDWMLYFCVSNCVLEGPIYSWIGQHIQGNINYGKSNRELMYRIKQIR
jgi:hypothetical protein